VITLLEKNTINAALAALTAAEPHNGEDERRAMIQLANLKEFADQGASIIVSVLPPGLVEDLKDGTRD